MLAAALGPAPPATQQLVLTRLFAVSWRFHILRRWSACIIRPVISESIALVTATR
jgi:hypothetical protein